MSFKEWCERIFTVKCRSERPKVNWFGFLDGQIRTHERDMDVSLYGVGHR